MKKEIIEQWFFSEAQQKKFSGWDFSYLKDRYHQEALPWEYSKLVSDYLKAHWHWLDVGTGGGELLLTFAHEPALTAVTEGWLPNYRLLLDRLQLKGIQVVFEDENHHLAFSKESFELVTSSQAAFSVSEVKRVLKLGGYFITQQVGDQNGNSLAKRLNCAKPTMTFNLASVRSELEQAGFMILNQGEAYPKQIFYDLTGLIYYVRTIPWEYPDFSVKEKLAELEILYREWQRKGVIENQQHRFMLVAQKRTD